MEHKESGLQYLSSNYLGNLLRNVDTFSPSAVDKGGNGSLARFERTLDVVRSDVVQKCTLRMESLPQIKLKAMTSFPKDDLDSIDQVTGLLHTTVKALCRRVESGERALSDKELRLLHANSCKIH
jgi:hypothetical protein